MRVIYTNESPKFDQPSIFLAGPSPRTKDQISWRIKALEILANVRINYPGLMVLNNGWDGAVFVPEHNPALASTKLEKPDFNYSNQVEWEYECLTKCSAIAFWVPRDVSNGWMGLTTNVEFGRFGGDPRTHYGRPNNADHIKYLDWHFNKYQVKSLPKKKIHNNLEELLNEVIIHQV